MKTNEITNSHVFRNELSGLIITRVKNLKGTVSDCLGTHWSSQVPRVERRNVICQRSLGLCPYKSVLCDEEPYVTRSDPTGPEL